MKVKAKKIIAAYRKDMRFRAEIMLYVNLVINLCYAVFEAFCGYFFSSSWMGTLAFYYIVLSVMRVRLLKGHKNKNINRRWKTYRFCGITILLLTIALAGVHMLTIKNIHLIVYHKYMIYAIAAYTTYTVYSAIRNVVKYRKINDPIFSASKAINLAVAAISIYNLQSAMITAFGNDESFRTTMGNCVGIGVFIVIVGISVLMITRASRVLKLL